MKFDKSDLIKDFFTGIQYLLVRISDEKGNGTTLLLCFDRNFLANKLHIQGEKSEQEKIKKWTDKEIEKSFDKLFKASDLFKKRLHYRIYTGSPERRKYILEFLKKKDLI